MKIVGANPSYSAICLIKEVILNNSFLLFFNKIYIMTSINRYVVQKNEKPIKDFLEHINNKIYWARNRCIVLSEKYPEEGSISEISDKINKFKYFIDFKLKEVTGLNTIIFSFSPYEMMDSFTREILTLEIQIIKSKLREIEINDNISELEDKFYKRLCLEKELEIAEKKLGVNSETLDMLLESYYKNDY